MQEASGEVVSVGPDQVTIRSSSGGSSMNFLADGATISRELAADSPATLGTSTTLNLRDIRPGDRVRIDYILRSGRPAAQMIEIISDSRG